MWDLAIGVFDDGGIYVVYLNLYGVLEGWIEIRAIISCRIVYFAYTNAFITRHV